MRAMGKNELVGLFLSFVYWTGILAGGLAFNFKDSIESITKAPFFVLCLLPLIWFRKDKVSEYLIAPFAILLAVIYTAGFSIGYYENLINIIPCVFLGMLGHIPYAIGQSKRNNNKKNIR
jgi:hypothetical protein